MDFDIDSDLVHKKIKNVVYEKTKDILKHLKLLENVLKYLMQENNSRCCIE